MVLTTRSATGSITETELERALATYSLLPLGVKARP